MATTDNTTTDEMEDSADEYGQAADVEAYWPTTGPIDELVDEYVEVFDIMDVRSSYTGEEVVNIDSADIAEVVEEHEEFQHDGDQKDLPVALVDHPHLTLCNMVYGLRRYLQTDDVIPRPVGKTRNHKLVEDICTADRNRLVSVDGRITACTGVSSYVREAEVKCTSCGARHTVEQRRLKSDKPTNPDRCKNSECGARKSWTPLVHEETAVDMQRAVLQDFHDSTEEEEPEDITIELKSDLARSVKKGAEVRITAKVKVYEDPSNNRELMLDVVGVEPLEKDSQSVELTDEDRERNQEFAAREDTIEFLAGAIAPELQGEEYDVMREAILLQAASMSPIAGSPDMRSQLHCGLVGDAGKGKTKMLDDSEKISSKSVYVSGEDSSSAGLTAGVERKSQLGGADDWTVKPGAFVRAHGGLAILDEIDKANPQDINKLHRALESQEVKVNKIANAELKSETALLASANPDEGNWDPTKPAPAQLSFDAPLLSRIDLVYQVIDDGDEELDRDIAKDDWERSSTGKEYPVSHEEVRKYVAEANQIDAPTLPPELGDLFADIFVELRGTDGEDEDLLQSSIRVKDSVKRIASASARLRLADEVAAEDLYRAKRLIEESMRQTGTDENGNIDKAVQEYGKSSAQFDRVRAIFDEVEALSGDDGSVEKDTLLASLDADGWDMGLVQKDIENLLQKTDGLYEPEDGVYRTA